MFERQITVSRDEMSESKKMREPGEQNKEIRQEAKTEKIRG